MDSVFVFFGIWLFTMAFFTYFFMFHFVRRHKQEDGLTPRAELKGDSIGKGRGRIALYDDFLVANRAYVPYEKIQSIKVIEQRFCWYYRIVYEGENGLRAAQEVRATSGISIFNATFQEILADVLVIETRN